MLLVTRRVTGRVVRALLNDPSEWQGDAVRLLKRYLARHLYRTLNTHETQMT